MLPASHVDATPAVETPRARGDGTAPLSREQILEATCRCLREVGYDATTIRKIASELHCAVGSIYRYFRDKRELLSVVTQQALEPVAEAIERGAGVGESVRLYHELAAREPETYGLMFWLACPPQGAAASAAGGAGGPGDGPAAGCRLPEVVQRIVAGWGGQLGARSAAEHAWAMLHGALLMGRSAEEALAWMEHVAASSRGSRRPTDRPAASANSQNSPEPAEARPASPQVVITMREPPLPRPAAPSANPAPAPAGHDRQATGEDVCLL